MTSAAVINDDYDDRGHGGRDGRERGRDYRGRYNDDAPVYRERSRSPRRRVWGQGGGRRARQQDEFKTLQDLPEVLPQLNQLHNLQSCRLHDLFKVHAAALQDAAQHIIGWPGEEKAVRGFMAAIQTLFNDYIAKACTLAASLGLAGAPPLANQSNGGSGIGATGNEASSAALKHAVPNTTVPLSDVFARLLRDIPTKSTTTPILHAAVAPECSITEVDQALQLLQLQPPGAAAPAQASAEPTSAIVNMQAACYQAIFTGLNV